MTTIERPRKKRRKLRLRKEVREFLTKVWDKTVEVSAVAIAIYVWLRVIIFICGIDI